MKVNLRGIADVVRERFAEKDDIGLDDSQLLPALFFAFPAGRDFERIVVDTYELHLDEGI